MRDDGVEGLRAHYGPLLDAHGPSFRALDWGSERSQRRRFGVLLDVADDLGEHSIVDVGCGLGHLTETLDARGHRGAYLGIDALPEMVAAARERRPDRTFAVATASDVPAADLVVSSGIFAFEPAERAFATVRTMFAACRVATAWNALSSWGESPQAGESTIDPLAALAFSRTLTPWVALRHDYLPHDFTVYLYRRDPA